MRSQARSAGSRSPARWVYMHTHMYMYIAGYTCGYTCARWVYMPVYVHRMSAYRMGDVWDASGGGRGRMYAVRGRMA